MYDYNHMELDPQREGACANDIWCIYNQLPTNTNFTLQFLNFHKEKLEEINFLKFDDDTVIQEHIKRIENCFLKYGSSGYSNLYLEWNHGFGEAVLLKIVISPDE